MSKNIFITGTGTDIGKTFVTALIVKKMRDLGKDTVYYKAAVSGNTRDEEGNLIPGDIEYVNRIAKINGDLNEMVPYIYECAVSPHLASRIEGNPVKIEIVNKSFYNLSKKHDYVTMEGSGGILCPICFDEKEIWLEDFVKAFDLSSIIVANAGLGTINDVVLTVEYMKQKNMKIKGIILNHFHKGDIMEEDNKKMIEHRTGISVIACVKDDDEEIEIDGGILASLYE